MRAAIIRGAPYLAGPMAAEHTNVTLADREIIEAGAAEIVADSDRREREADLLARKACVSPQGGASAPPTSGPVAHRPDG